MSVKYERKEFTDMLPVWKRCMDVCAGQDAIHSGGVTYLPQLKDQDITEYNNYLKRTPFYNATWRTIVGLQGMLFRKPPTVVVPDIVKPMIKNIDLAGTSLHIFALETAEECLKVGRVGIFVDFPVVPEGATAADALVHNYRPSMRMYKTASIINWKTITINNETILSMIVLKEVSDVKVDEFEDKAVPQWRVLDLMTIGNTSKDLVYRVRVYQRDEDKDLDVLISEAYPMINGGFLNRIPFQFIGVDDTDCDIDEPPLIDLVDMNISHYQTTADYEHGCHFTGLPTPVITGYTPEIDGSKFYIGSTTAWVFNRSDAKAFYLEFTGEGLGSLKANMDKKEGHMAILGARMLEVQVRGVESANTAAIHRGGEQSMLASVAQSISIGMTNVLKIFCNFAGAPISDDVDKAVTQCKFDLNRDFFPVPMDALTLTAIIAAWQNGAISYETMFSNLQTAEIIPLENTAKTEMASIKANPPPMIAAGTTPGSPHPNAPKGDATPATPVPTIKQLQKGA